jgi:hypothetical protein
MALSISSAGSPATAASTPTRTTLAARVFPHWLAISLALIKRVLVTFSLIFSTMSRGYFTFSAHFRQRVDPFVIEFYHTIGFQIIPTNGLLPAFQRPAILSASPFFIYRRNKLFSPNLTWVTSCRPFEHTWTSVTFNHSPSAPHIGQGYGW